MPTANRRGLSSLQCGRRHWFNEGRLRFLGVSFSVSLLACGGAAASQKATGKPAQGRSVEVVETDTVRLRPLKLVEIAVQEDVTAFSVPCSPNRDETCNGFDDNCDGRVDEGCGFEAGALAVTLVWNSRADIDLLVQEPTGEVLSAMHRESGLGGHFDRVGRGDCGEGETAGRLERVVWPLAAMRSGVFTIEANYWGECGVQPGLTTVSLALEVGGKPTGDGYTYRLSPGEHKHLVSLTLD